HHRCDNIVWNVVAEQDGKERPDREFESSEEGGHRRYGSARDENANGQIVLCGAHEAEPSDELGPAADKMNECGPCSGTRGLAQQRCLGLRWRRWHYGGDVSALS